MRRRPPGRLWASHNEGENQWRNDGVAAASSDGGPTGGRGPPTVLEFLVINFRGPDLRK